LHRVTERFADQSTWIPSLIVVDAVVVVVGKHRYCSRHFVFARDDFRNDVLRDRKATMTADESRTE
jgi:hypothetical protein